MKRIIAIVLVAVFATLALVSCNNNTKKPGASTPSKTTPSTPTQSTSAGSNASTPESTPDLTPENTTFDTRDEVVYTTADLNLRTTNNFNSDSNVAHIALKGTQLKRVGVGIEDPSVSKVVYEGKEYFCGSKYLTTEAPSTAPESSTEATPDEPVVFEDRNETVKVLPDEATVYTVAYKGWSAQNRKNVANFVLTKDTEVKVTGICYENPNDLEVGWARIEYQTNTYYVRISVLGKISGSTTTPEATAEATPVATPEATPAATTAATPVETTSAN